MQLDGSVTLILITKVVLAILAFVGGGYLAWAGVNILRGEKGKFRSAISKFKFWGIDMSSPSAGLTVVVVSVAWILVGVRIVPEVEIQDGPIRITFQDISKPVASTVASLKAPIADSSPTVENTISQFEALAARKYRASPGATVETDIEFEDGRPVFSLRATSGQKTIEEKYVASVRNGKMEFTPVEVSALDTKLPEVSMRFDCQSSIAAFLRKLQIEPKRSDVATHRQALQSLCTKEIQELPEEQKSKINIKE